MIGRRSVLLAGAAFMTLASATMANAQSTKEISIGSKAFTENLIAANLMAELLENAGYEVNRKLGLGGTAVVHQAIVSGEIDAYLEYTGTGMVALLKLPVENNPDAAYEIVKREYNDRFGLAWLKPWGFNDTNAFAMPTTLARELGVSKISDLKGKAENLTIGGTQEGVSRSDSLPAVEQTYDLKFKDAKGMDFGLIYPAVRNRQVDVVMVFSTDSRIAANELTVLQDDLHVFPPYYGVPVVRNELLKQSPEVADILNVLAGKIDDQTMLSLNAQVDIEKKEPADVARDFLKAQGLIP